MGGRVVLLLRSPGVTPPAVPIDLTDPAVVRDLQLVADLDAPEPLAG